MKTETAGSEGAVMGRPQDAAALPGGWAELLKDRLDWARFRHTLEQAEAERDAQKERAKIQTERAEIAEAQRDLLSMEIEKLRNELARLQKPVQ